VGHLDDRDTRSVQRGHDGTDLVLGELVTLMVRPSRSDVSVIRTSHTSLKKIRRCSCLRSSGCGRLLFAQALMPAARDSFAISYADLGSRAVMMSRLPAYGGR